MECVGADGVRITVDWGGSAWELARWDMEGRLDAETMMVDYTGCVKKVITFGRDGSVAVCATEYEDGTGTVVFLEDGTFTWREDQVEREPLCFVPVPVTAAAGILHEEEFGGAYVLLTIDEFNDLGFTYGDSVRIEFSNGFVMEDLPYYNGYYTVTGEPLLVASSSGKNAAARGIMGKIREMMALVVLPRSPNASAASDLSMDFINMGSPMGYVSGVDTYSWSMSTYVSRVRSRLGELAEADEAWDELEKSIVANLADEVTVNIVGNAVKIVITKTF